MKKTREIIELFSAADTGHALPSPSHHGPNLERASLRTWAESPSPSMNATRDTYGLERRSGSYLERRSGNYLERRSGKPPTAPSGFSTSDWGGAGGGVPRDSSGVGTPGRRSLDRISGGQLAGPAPGSSALERSSMTAAVPASRTDIADVDALVGAVVHMHLDGGVASTSADHFHLAGTHLPEDLARLLLDDRCPLQLLWSAGWLLRQLLPAERAGRGPSNLTVDQKTLLDKAFKSAADALLAECEGTWGESIPQLLRSSWAASRMGISSPGLSASAEQYLLDRTTLAAGGAIPPGDTPAHGPANPAVDPAKASLQVAIQCTGNVLRALTILQIRALLRNGRVPTEPPFPAESCHLQSATQEGVEISMEGREHLVCKVSFQKGLEQTVYFFTRPSWEKWSGGDSPVSVAASPSTANRLHGSSRLGRDSVNGDGGSNHSHAHGNAGCATARRLCSPQIVLGVPIDDFNARVLATAPLYGARPEVDKRHGRWLHVHVRPPLADLVRSVSSVPPLAAQAMLRRTSMRDGHWVLAFPDAERSHAARELVERALQAEQAAVRTILAPFCAIDEPPPGSAAAATPGPGGATPGRSGFGAAAAAAAPASPRPTIPAPGHRVLGEQAPPPSQPPTPVLSPTTSLHIQLPMHGSFGSIAELIPMGPAGPSGVTASPAPGFESGRSTPSVLSPGVLSPVSGVRSPLSARSQAPPPLILPTDDGEFAAFAMMGGLAAVPLPAVPEPRSRSVSASASGSMGPSTRTSETEAT